MFLTSYCGGCVVPLPLCEAAGGQGVPDGVVPVPGCELPEVLAPLFPGVEGDAFEDSEFDDSEFADPEFDVPGVAAPGAGVELLGVPAVPGNGPHGEPLGVVPGVFCVFGFTVEGCMLFPSVGVAVPAGGVVVLAGGVAVPAGGVAACAGGVAVPGGGVAERGAELCPAEPAGAPCATAQAAHKRITDNKLAFLTDISCPPNLNLNLKKPPKLQIFE